MLLKSTLLETHVEVSPRRSSVSSAKLTRSPLQVFRQRSRATYETYRTTTLAQRQVTPGE